MPAERAGMGVVANSSSVSRVGVGGCLMRMVVAAVVVVVTVVVLVGMQLVVLLIVVRLRLHRAHDVARSAGLTGVRYWVMQLRLGRVGSSTMMAAGARPFFSPLLRS